MKGPDFIVKTIFPDESVVTKCGLKIKDRICNKKANDEDLINIAF